MESSDIILPRPSRVIYCYDECHYAEGRYAEYRGA